MYLITNFLTGFATLTRSLQGIIINDTNIRPNDYIDHLSMLPAMTREKAGDLLDPGDKQNVPKAINLVEQLDSLRHLPIPQNPNDSHNRKIISFYAKTLGHFVFPFIRVGMSLSEQVRSLSTYAHITAALYIKHGTACLTSPLYADSQAVIKNIIITIARLQILNPDLRFYIILEGTDRIEVLFCDTRTLDHARNFDIEQLAQKLSLGTLINATFQRNPDLDRGHRRLKLDGALGIDHVNIVSWTGDARVGNCHVQLEYDAGRDIANDILEEYFGPEARVDFLKIWEKPNHDLLRPKGVYVSTSWTEDDIRSEMENDMNPVSNTPAANTNTPAVAPSSIVQPAEDDFDDDDTGLDLDDFFPDTPAGIDDDEPPLAFSRHLIAEDGKEYLKSSIIATLSSNRSKKATMRTLRVRGVALEDLRQKQLNIDFDPSESEDVLKSGDLVGVLLRVGDQICLGVISVKGFRVGADKTLKTTMEMDQLEQNDTGVKVVGQILEMKSESNSWKWTGNYLRLDTRVKDAQAAHKHFLLEFSSVLIHPLGPTLSALNGETTWIIAANQLEDVLEYAWEMLDPESEQVMANIELLPQVTNPSCLPYRDSSGNYNLQPALKYK